MIDKNFEQRLEQLMSQDLSIGTEKFRDGLLAQCLSIIQSDRSGSDLNDDFLELLSAAGDPYTLKDWPFLSDN